MSTRLAKGGRLLNKGKAVSLRKLVDNSCRLSVEASSSCCRLMASVLSVSKTTVFPSSGVVMVVVVGDNVSLSSVGLTSSLKGGLLTIILLVKLE